MEKWISIGAERLWGWPTMGLFLLVGLLYTVGLRGIQFRRLPEALKSITTGGGSDRGISTYSALCTALAATIGTGNIVGVATAISAGGPGALFWMLVAAFLGMGTQFAEGYLAVRYKPKGKGEVGGPFSYMEEGLNKPRFGKVYAMITVVASILGVGTITQINSITKGIAGLTPDSTTVLGYPVITIVVGLTVTVVTGFILFGGMSRVTKVCETLVPLMSALYLICSFTLLILNAKKIPHGISLILRGAFRPKAVVGAGCGICMRQVLRMGIGRGVFTNEAGMGTGAIAAAASAERDPVKQGLVTMSATFIDTIVICTITGLSLIVTGAWNQPLEGGKITDFAWRTGLPWSGTLSSYLLVLCLVFFAFATIIGWSFYGERCLLYLSGGKGVKLYRWGYLLALAIGPFLSVSVVFNLSDILNAMMALPNLTALLLLRREVVTSVRNSS